MRKLWILFALLPLALSAGVVNITYTFTDFGLTPQAVKRATQTPLCPFADYNGAILTASPAAQVTSGAGAVTFSNTVAGYSYRIQLDTPYGSTIRTCAPPTSISGNINGRDYLGTGIGCPLVAFYYLYPVVTNVTMLTISNVAASVYQPGANVTFTTNPGPVITIAASGALGGIAAGTNTLGATNGTTVTLSSVVSLQAITNTAVAQSQTASNAFLNAAIVAFLNTVRAAQFAVTNNTGAGWTWDNMSAPGNSLDIKTNGAAGYLVRVGGDGSVSAQTFHGDGSGLSNIVSTTTITGIISNQVTNVLITATGDVTGTTVGGWSGANTNKLALTVTNASSLIGPIPQVAVPSYVHTNGMTNATFANQKIATNAPGVGQILVATSASGDTAWQAQQAGATNAVQTNASGSATIFSNLTVNAVIAGNAIGATNQQPLAFQLLTNTDSMGVFDGQPHINWYQGGDSMAQYDESPVVQGYLRAVARRGYGGWGTLVPYSVGPVIIDYDRSGNAQYLKVNFLASPSVSVVGQPSAYGPFGHNLLANSGDIICPSNTVYGNGTTRATMGWVEYGATNGGGTFFIDSTTNSATGWNVLATVNTSIGAGVGYTTNYNFTFTNAAGGTNQYMIRVRCSSGVNVVVGMGLIDAFHGVAPIMMCVGGNDDSQFDTFGGAQNANSVTNMFSPAWPDIVSWCSAHDVSTNQSQSTIQGADGTGNYSDWGTRLTTRSKLLHMNPSGKELTLWVNRPAQFSTDAYWIYGSAVRMSLLQDIGNVWDKPVDATSICAAGVWTNLFGYSAGHAYPHWSYSGGALVAGMQAQVIRAWNPVAANGAYLTNIPASSIVGVVAAANSTTNFPIVNSTNGLNINGTNFIDSIGQFFPRTVIASGSLVTSGNVTSQGTVSGVLFNGNGAGLTNVFLNAPTVWLHTNLTAYYQGTNYYWPNSTSAGFNEAQALFPRPTTGGPHGLKIVLDSGVYPYTGIITQNINLEVSGAGQWASTVLYTGPTNRYTIQGVLTNPANCGTFVITTNGYNVGGPVYGALNNVYLHDFSLQQSTSCPAILLDVVAANVLFCQRFGRFGPEILYQTNAANSTMGPVEKQFITHLQQGVAGYLNVYADCAMEDCYTMSLASGDDCVGNTYLHVTRGSMYNMGLLAGTADGVVTNAYPKTNLYGLAPGWILRGNLFSAVFDNPQPYICGVPFILNGCDKVWINTFADQYPVSGVSVGDTGSGEVHIEFSGSESITNYQMITNSGGGKFGFSPNDNDYTSQVEIKIGTTVYDGPQAVLQIVRKNQGLGDRRIRGLIPPDGTLALPPLPLLTNDDLLHINIEGAQNAFAGVPSMVMTFKPGGNFGTQLLSPLGITNRVSGAIAPFNGLDIQQGGGLITFGIWTNGVWAMTNTSDSDPNSGAPYNYTISSNGLVQAYGLVAPPQLDGGGGTDWSSQTWADGSLSDVLNLKVSWGTNSLARQNVGTNTDMSGWSSNPTNAFVVGTLYTNGADQKALQGAAVLTGATGTANITCLYTNVIGFTNLVGYAVPMQAGAAITEVLPFYIAIDPYTRFKFVGTFGTGASGYITNTVSVSR